MEEHFLTDILTADDDPTLIFEILDLLGEGNYGSVWKALHQPTGELVAVQIVPNTGQIASLQQEILILKECQSPYIVQYFGSYFKDQSLWLIIEYCSAGSVIDLIKITQIQLNEYQIASILKSTLQGLEYLHSNQKIHRDIKAGNILLDHRGNAQLADFGVSAQLMHTLADQDTVIGTPYWMSPEVISQSQYNQKTDIWSLGITAIQLAEGQPPYSHIHPFRAMFVIQNKPPSGLTDPDRWSPEFNDFIQKCLIIDPNDRPTSTELLSHPFIAKKARGKAILSELVLNSMDAIQNYRNNKDWKQNHDQKKNEDDNEDDSDENYQNTMVYKDNSELGGAGAEHGTMIEKKMQNFKKKENPVLDYEECEDDLSSQESEENKLDYQNVSSNQQKPKSVGGGGAYRKNPTNTNREGDQEESKEINIFDNNMNYLFYDQNQEIQKQKIQKEQLLSVIKDDQQKQMADEYEQECSEFKCDTMIIDNQAEQPQNAAFVEIAQIMQQASILPEFKNSENREQEMSKPNSNNNNLNNNNNTNNINNNNKSSKVSDSKQRTENNFNQDLQRESNQQLRKSDINTMSLDMLENKLLRLQNDRDAEVAIIMKRYEQKIMSCEEAIQRKVEQKNKLTQMPPKSSVSNISNNPINNGNGNNSIPQKKLSNISNNASTNNNQPSNTPIPSTQNTSISQQKNIKTQSSEQSSNQRSNQSHSQKSFYSEESSQVMDSGHELQSDEDDFVLYDNTDLSHYIKAEQERMADAENFKKKDYFEMNQLPSSLESQINKGQVLQEKKSQYQNKDQQKLVSSQSSQPAANIQAALSQSEKPKSSAQTNNNPSSSNSQVNLEPSIISKLAKMPFNFQVDESLLLKLNNLTSQNVDLKLNIPVTNDPNSCLQSNTSSNTTSSNNNQSPKSNKPLPFEFAPALNQSAQQSQTKPHQDESNTSINSSLNNSKKSSSGTGATGSQDYGSYVDKQNNKIYITEVDNQYETTQNSSSNNKNNSKSNLKSNLNTNYNNGIAIKEDSQQKLISQNLPFSFQPIL